MARAERIVWRAPVEAIDPGGSAQGGQPFSERMNTSTEGGIAQHHAQHRGRVPALGALPVFSQCFVGGRPEDYAAFIRTELAKWSKVIRDVGIKTE
mgnify:CR=1 FL=1